jgi:hypothetical protein
MVDWEDWPLTKQAIGNVADEVQAAPKCEEVRTELGKNKCFDLCCGRCWGGSRADVDQQPVETEIGPGVWFMDKGKIGPWI